ncbi:zinc finger protein 40 [Ambystoma mexicanum]|uniref:zinc finger protein 40 n=1 Tax=Ambystoma mexicanum TaxID=8296 RepID=UPI0037E87168
MPRTKQIHPKNLRDKIEEAQKKLQSPEDLQKDVLVTGGSAALDTVKGVKRKKIVTGNHLKKIPKSPLRARTQENLKHKTDEAEPFNSSNVNSEHTKDELHALLQNGQQYSEPNGGLCSEITVEPLESVTPMQTKKDSVPHQSLELCHAEHDERVSGDTLTLPGDACVSSFSSNKTRSKDLDFVDHSTSSYYTDTAFGVLLKAMEPELNTLTQRLNNCGAHTENVRPNKICSSFTSSLKTIHNTDSSHQELVTRTNHHPCAAHIVQMPHLGRSLEVQAQSPSKTATQHEQSLPQNEHCNQRPGSCPSSTNMLETISFNQIYSLSAKSSVTPTVSSSVPSALAPHQLTANSSQPVSISPSNSTQFSVGSAYNLAQVASLVNQGGEQMCTVLLKDHKSRKQGKYVCEYCNRACAKPSVLLKHIRSHTGERPYPCVTCGFSFKTKSNLYKHKKSHAHAIKLGRNTDPGGLIFSQDSDKSLYIHSDLDESGESDDEYTSEERLEDQHDAGLGQGQAVLMIADSQLHTASHMQISHHDHPTEEHVLLEKSREASTVPALPKVVVYPVDGSPSKATSPKQADANSKYVVAQRETEYKSTHMNPGLVHMPSLPEAVLKNEEVLQTLEKQVCNAVASHAQLQRQQATDFSQDQQGKSLLSPRSLGSTDSGYFSRSESADQAMSPPTPFIRVLPICEKDASKNLVSVSHTNTSIASVVQMVCSEKPLLIAGTMRPPVGTKTLEERISKLISDNEAVVDDKQLDSVKPRRTSLSRRGSIDSPKSYIFKDSFQFDLKPVGRRTSSGSEIPKSPFTPTEKSKQVFFLSVPSQFPSLDCLPITRSNSMPNSGCSAVPAPVIPPPHPLRGSQSFDDKIGLLCDDVFVSGPSTTLHQVCHPRTLVRQTAIEDSANDSHGLGPARSADDGCNTATEVLLPRIRSFAQGSSLEKLKKSHQGRGTMFECETCRNRYRKLENFENHKKFYCSELHGPKSKPAVRDSDQNVVTSSISPQILHYRVAVSTGILEQPPQIRKRRKVKSVGDDDEPQQQECGKSTDVKETVLCQNTPGSCSSSSKNNVVITGQYSSIPLPNSQMQLVSRGTEESMEPKPSSTFEKVKQVSQERVELKRQGSGISVIQHTNSLSRPSSFEKSESFERASPVSFQDADNTAKAISLNNAVVISVDEYSNQNPSHSHRFITDVSSIEVQEILSVVTNERITCMPQSRLVRQHNIQVPEILVTEEPDRDAENTATDQEITEKFNWPQRSESLSNLPTEKLPPKKKRIRLADLENSSGESSFDSTLSRSLSRDSSLSRASSFSASFEKEDLSKTECASNVDVATKSEFLMLPSGSNNLGVPREMRRAASEQITCTQPSMEVPQYRSKSFDCGSMSPSSPVLPTETITPRSICTGVTGHVPLLERRRGPFVRQISLSIAPENTLPQGISTCLFQKAPESSTAPFHKIQAYCHAPTVLSESSLHLPTYIKSLIESNKVVKNCNSSCLPPVEQAQSDIRAQPNQSSLHHDKPASADKTREGEEQNICSSSSPFNEPEHCFTPKYQLHLLTRHENPIYACDQAPNREFPHNQGLGNRAISMNILSDVCDSTPSNYPVPQQNMSTSNKVQPRSHFVVPVHDYSNLSPYGCSSITKLPEILVTQDQVNMPPVCKENNVPVPKPEVNLLMPIAVEDPPRTLEHTSKSPENEHLFSEAANKNSISAGSFSLVQKVTGGGLLPQQEATASSKRMLSPANSLDIAMEKNQKRVKDESGAAFTKEARSAHLLSMKLGEQNRPKKPVLVRQVCTTEPLDGSDQEAVAQERIKQEIKCPMKVLLCDSPSTDPSISQVSDSMKETSVLANVKFSLPLCSPKQKSPEPSLINSDILHLKSSGTSQERRLTVTCQGKQISIQGQVKLRSSISVINAGDMHRLSFPSLKTTTSFTWCYLLKRKPLQMPQNDLKTSAYSAWTVSSINPNPLGLPTKVALSLLNSKQKDGKLLYSQPVTTRPRSDLLVYSSKWKNRANKKKLAKHTTATGDLCDENTEATAEYDKDGYSNRHEPRRVKIFDGGYKSNEEYVYVRGRGRGKYICEECGIRCKKPSMLKKHIRTHTDVRPYHCNYCNFSFKTKGNLTKHMKSKAHSKKCLDMGVSDDLYDDPDADESGERHRFGCDRPGYDVDDSDGPDEDENDNDDEDEDSQAESVLSTTPSVSASPQHHPYRNCHHESSSADEDLRIPECSSRADSMDMLPKALLTKMTALRTAPENKGSHPQVAPCQQETGESSPHKASYANGGRTLDTPPKSLCHQMSVDSPDAEESPNLIAPSTSVAKDVSTVKVPLSPVDRGTQTTMVAPFMAFAEFDLHPQKPHVSKQHLSEAPTTETHLFSHLPLHSQHHARAPYSMIPLGGIQLVPAGLAAYSAFLPIQAGPVQLTFPAVGVLQRNANALSDKSSETSGPTNSAGIAEMNSVLPCIPLGQVHVPGLPKLSTPLPPLSMETLNILGLTNSNLAPQMHPSGLTLNALGLQVLTASPSAHSNTVPQTHIPGLQILNLALPTLIPSVSPIAVDAQELPGSPTSRNNPSEVPLEQRSMRFPITDTSQFVRAGSSQVQPLAQDCNVSKTSGPAAEYIKLNAQEKQHTERVDKVRHPHQPYDIASSRSRTACFVPEPYLKVKCDSSSRCPIRQTLSPERQISRRVGLTRIQNTVQFSDASSDDDEDRLVIAT